MPPGNRISARRLYENPVRDAPKDLQFRRRDSPLYWAEARSRGTAGNRISLNYCHVESQCGQTTEEMVPRKAKRNRTVWGVGDRASQRAGVKAAPYDVRSTP